VIELLIYRCPTPYSIMHTAATVVVPHTAKGVALDKMEKYHLFFVAPFYTVPLGVK
jgi:hypothetical protein